MQVICRALSCKSYVIIFPLLKIISINIKLSDHVITAKVWKHTTRDDSSFYISWTNFFAFEIISMFIQRLILIWIFDQVTSYGERGTLRSWIGRPRLQSLKSFWIIHDSKSPCESRIWYSNKSVRVGFDVYLLSAEFWTEPLVTLRYWILYNLRTIVRPKLVWVWSRTIW